MVNIVLVYKFFSPPFNLTNLAQLVSTVSQQLKAHYRLQAGQMRAKLLALTSSSAQTSSQFFL